MDTTLLLFLPLAQVASVAEPPGPEQAAADEVEPASDVLREVERQIAEEKDEGAEANQEESEAADLLDRKAWPKEFEPDRRVCIDILHLDIHPAAVEWSWWLGLGGGLRGAGGSDERWGFSARLGASASFELARFETSEWAHSSDLRWGPWLGAETHFDGVLGEGGIELSYGRIAYRRSWTTTVRVGAGHAADAEGRSHLLSATLTTGLRSIPGRRHDRGACEPPTTPRGSATAVDLRFFVTGRSELSEERGFTLLGGVEFSPGLLLPPYSCQSL